MDPLQNRIEQETLEDLIATCRQVAEDCFSIANSLNTGPVTLSALSKECRAITNALERVHDLSKATEGDIESVRASKNQYINYIARDVHELRGAVKRIKAQDRDSGIDLAEPHLIIVWNEPTLKESLGRMRTHQASLHTLLNTATRQATPYDRPSNSQSGYSFNDDLSNRRRVIEPDAGVDEALRELGRRFSSPNHRSRVLPRVSDSAEIQVLLDTLVPPPGCMYRQEPEVANQLHSAIESADEEAVFKILLARADPNILLPGSVLSPLHRAFDKKHLLIAALLVVAGADVDEPTIEGETALIRGIKCGFSEQFATLVVHLGARIDAIDNEGRCALHHSAASNVLDDETMEVLIKAGAKLNIADDEKGQTPLHVAIQQSRWNLATKLIQAGADLEVRQPDGKTALHLAISMRNHEFAQLLISRGANVDRVLRDHTPLTMAISLRCTAISAVLIDSGAEPNLASRNGNTPLLAAASTGHDETVRYLLAHGADPSACPSQSGYTAMHMAAHKDKPHILQLLVSSGAPVDPLDRACETPLLVAAKLGNGGSARRLIKLGADTERIGPDGMSVLSHAVKAGDLKLVNALLEMGTRMPSSTVSRDSMSDEEYQVPEPQTTPIHMAAQHARDDILLRLVSSGASMESTIFPGRTPLHVAARHGHLSTVQLLLRLGANAHALTTHGDTVLFEASANQATLKYLLQQGVEVNHRNDQGATALHYAALRGHIGAVKLLLEKGARQFHASAVYDAWEERDEGRPYRQGTPAGVALQRDLTKVADLIEKWKYT
ncbi:ankyrin repeat-containing domain protein [Thelonectria olida]|uniref:Ankyrin repeat-containing domain protein n=1 Tax=Thelonectria olida TaxID=1576542 RepID=A0A9P8VVR4_9HYPO|nr:ankyrin repeat-containing domain protein [Thelonectria olida]